MKFNYQDLIQNGFVRINCEDSVFFDQYGFHYFILSKQLNQHWSFDWDVNTQKLRLLKVDESQSITYSKFVESEAEFDFIEELLIN
jgi:hypothetical protein